MKSFILAVLTSKAFRKSAVAVVMAVLHHLAKRSDNRLDDEILAVVEMALYPVEPPPENESQVK